MNIAVLGYGKEGKSVEAYFKKRGENITIFDNFSLEDIPSFNLKNFDLVFRSPSIKPCGIFSSITKYFFDHCPCQIIGVTGTKGKGTTCSMITKILEALGKKVWLVGNIGNPALDVLDEISPEDVVVYELSSFQLWDLEKSPHIAVVLRIEPDHLNVHKDFNDYLMAKANVATHQTANDYCVYYANNPNSQKIANLSRAHKISYPINNKENLLDILSALKVPGDHNKENAEAAILAVSCYYEKPLNDFIINNAKAISSGLANFHGLPHHIEFVRELNGISFYDDNYSASFPSLDVAIATFPERNIILIAGGKNRNLDLAQAKKRIFNSSNVSHAILIGETKNLLSENEDPKKYSLAETLSDAVNIAYEKAKKYKNSIVLMSPGAASFDMFKNFIDRGKKFQKIVKELS